MVNRPLIRPCLLGGVALGGGTLDSHDFFWGEISWKKPFNLCYVKFCPCFSESTCTFGGSWILRAQKNSESVSKNSLMLLFVVFVFFCVVWWLDWFLVHLSDLWSSSSFWRGPWGMVLKKHHQQVSFVLAGIGRAKSLSTKKLSLRCCSKAFLLRKRNSKRLWKHRRSIGRRKKRHSCLATSERWSLSVLEFYHPTVLHAPSARRTRAQDGTSGGQKPKATICAMWCALAKILAMTSTHANQSG